MDSADPGLLPPPPPPQTCGFYEFWHFVDFAIKTDQNEQNPRVVGSHGIFKACVTHTNGKYKQTQRR